MGATIKVLLISANREDINMLTLPMGLACVATAVETAGHAVRFLGLLLVKDIPVAVEGAIRMHQPEVIGVSVRNVDEQAMDKGRFLPDQVKKVVRRISETNLKINGRCIFYPGVVPRELVEAMSKAGCREVSLGFESGSENILQRMNKHFGIDKIREASRLLADVGIRRMGFLLLGGPGETKASFEESLSFGDSLNLDSLKLTLGIRS